MYTAEEKIYYDKMMLVNRKGRKKKKEIFLKFLDEFDFDEEAFVESSGEAPFGAEVAWLGL